MADNNNEMFERNPILIGTVITVISYFFGLSSVSFLVGAMTVGFMIGTDRKKGVINGTIMGVIALVISIIIYAILILVQGYDLSVLNMLIGAQVVALILQIILAAIGGVLGSMVRAETEN